MQGWLLILVVGVELMSNLVETVKVEQKHLLSTMQVIVDYPRVVNIVNHSMTLESIH